MAIEGAMDAEVFRSYVSEVLCPSLKEVMSLGITLGVISLQVVGSQSLAVQRFIVQIVEPMLLSAILFLYSIISRHLIASIIFLILITAMSTYTVYFINRKSSQRIFHSKSYD
jgi:hypothetical protein